MAPPAFNTFESRSHLTMLIILLMVGNNVTADAPYEFCPVECACDVFQQIVRCSELLLTETPNGIPPDVFTLDLSKNMFSEMPKYMYKLPELRTLNLSDNKIYKLSNTSLRNLSPLKILILSSNSINDWRNISSDALLPTKHLTTLDLSHNQLRAFPNFLPSIKSNTLKTLVLVNCSITSFPDGFVKDMPLLEKLILSGNPLISLKSKLFSKNLNYLDLSNCKIQTINEYALENLSNLKELVLSKNDRLGHFNVMSNLTKLDLSQCNLRSINTSNLIFLAEAIFKQNHIRQLTSEIFDNPHLEILDLSSNAISTVHENAFFLLPNLRILDLSVNTIATISTKTFTRNPKLVDLNLSRNYMSQVSKLKSQSLKRVNLSVCEINNIYMSSLKGLPNLIQLDLSRNLISLLPDKLSHSKLKSLDLQYCRIGEINNYTFESLPNLIKLNLAGNRLSKAFDPRYFKNIEFIRLDDNLWACDCDSKEYRDLYMWLLDGPQDPHQVDCFGPPESARKSWYDACHPKWEKEYSAGGNPWLLLLGGVLFIIFGGCVIYYSVEKYREREERREEEAREREREELQERNILRLQRIQENSETYVNAPDPRESQRPPSYAEAMNMAALSGSVGSLTSRSSRRSEGADNPEQSSRRNNRRNGFTNHHKRKSVASNLSALTIEEESIDSEFNPMIEPPARPNTPAQELDGNSSDYEGNNFASGPVRLNLNGSHNHNGNDHDNGHEHQMQCQLCNTNRNNINNTPMVTESDF